MIEFPAATAVHRRLPKEAFYKHLPLTKILKEKFVSDVDRIVVENSFTKENLNLASDADIGFPLINSKDRKTFEIPDELCNGTDIVKVTFRLTVEDLIDSELIQLYPISIVKQILKQEDI